MATVFFPKLSEKNNKYLCCYVNRTGKVAIARITNIPNWYCERVVFPQEQFLFEAPPNAELEIHGYTNIGLSQEVIPCAELRVSNNCE
ncbi:DUF1830 domain-containing protein [Lusitaniella coriacea]|uniref:DUF1830 domain-containing protein n=1 Tax=Lusitaniella coriacea TaxID=1983105 RepID=UPI003CF03D98